MMKMTMKKKRKQENKKEQKKEKKKGWELAVLCWTFIQYRRCANKAGEESVERRGSVA